MDKNKAIGYMVKLVKSMPKSTLIRCDDKLNLGISFLANASNEEVIAFVAENNLTSLENIAKLMVKLHIEHINAMYDGVYSIKQDYKNEWKSLLESARDYFEYALDNPNKKVEELGFARRQVMDCIRVFKNDIITHISVIREIDQYSKPELVLKSWFSLAKCRKEVPFATQTVKALIEAYKLLFIICTQTTDNISSLVYNHDQVGKEIMNDDNCILMAAYCEKEEDKEFWYNLSGLWTEQKHLFAESVEVFKDSKKNEASFWDDDVENLE